MFRSHSYLGNTSMLRDEVAHQPPRHYGVLLQIVCLYLLIYGASPFHSRLAMGEDEQLLAEPPKLRVWLHRTAEENVQPLLKGSEGQEVLTTALC